VPSSEVNLTSRVVPETYFLTTFSKNYKQMENLSKFDGVRIELKKSDSQHEECKVYGTTWINDNEVKRESIKISSKHPVLHCEVGKYD
jgi:predicted PilT family ATPase